MSSLAPDAAEYYYQYKVTVYDNLFVGIVYGEGTRDPTLLVQFLSHYALHHRRLHRTLRHLGLRPLVRFIYAPKKVQCTLTVGGFQEQTEFHFVSA